MDLPYVTISMASKNSGALVAFTKEVNLLWQSDALLQHRYGSTKAEVMACCLTTPSHYLN